MYILSIYSIIYRDNMSTKHKPEKHHFNLAMSEELYRKLRVIATLEGVSVTEFITAAARKELNALTEKKYSPSNLRKLLEEF